jgi:hypothetical protein
MQAINSAQGRHPDWRYFIFNILHVGAERIRPAGLHDPHTIEQDKDA